MESGHIPKTRQYLAKLSELYGVPETRFFLDPDLIRPSPQQALEVLSELVKQRK